MSKSNINFQSWILLSLTIVDPVTASIDLTSPRTFCHYAKTSLNIVVVVPGEQQHYDYNTVAL